MDVTVAVLAGGRGSRIGGDKAMVELAGRPLISYPLQAAAEAGLPAVVVAKPATTLPPLDVPVLLEPAEPTHPLLGVVSALSEFAAVIAVPCDMPFVLPSQLTALATIAADVAILGPGRRFPALYRRSCLPQLSEALEADRSMRSTQTQSSLASASISSTDQASRLTVNTREDLAEAERLLSRR